MLQAGCPAPLSSSLEAHRRKIQRPARYMSNSGAFARTLICSHSSCGGVPSFSPTHAPHASSQGLSLWNVERGRMLPASPLIVCPWARSNGHFVFWPGSAPVGHGFAGRVLFSASLSCMVVTGFVVGAGVFCRMVRSGAACGVVGGPQAARKGHGRDARVSGPPGSCTCDRACAHVRLAT